MSDPTEGIRRLLVDVINSSPRDRKALEFEYGEVYDTKEVQEKFEIKGFLAPFVGCTRRLDGVEGFLTFQDRPRFYFEFKES